MFNTENKIKEYLNKKLSNNELESLCAQLSKPCYKQLTDYIINLTSELDKLKGKNYSRRLYHYWYNLNEIPKCKKCSKGEVKYDSFGTGYKTYCSVKCMRNSKEYNTSREETCLEKYGVKFASQSNTVKNKMITSWASKTEEEHKKSHEKRKETCLEKYGVNHVLKNEKFKTKAENTCLEKYGTKNPMQNKDIQKKASKTYFNKTGYSNPSFNPKVITKISETYFNKTGYHNPSHNPEIIEKILKNTYKKKEYIFPSGRTEIVQGYEPQALNELIQTYNEDDLIIKDTEIAEHTGKIMYSINGKEHRYFPDIYIKSENKIIEVKSSWTYDGNGSNEPLKLINEAKREACEQLGFPFEFKIIDK